MDYDGDGILDFLSGSYDPGDVYLFRGKRKGKYAAVESLKDRAGVALVHHPMQLVKYHEMSKDPAADPDESIEARVASFGSWAFPVDWEGDGDLDLLIGSFSGKLFLRTNIGTRKKPSYHEGATQVQAGGRPLAVHGHADPVAADWNEDGRWDLLVGSSDGSVRWFENVGSKGEPVFAPGRVLVERKSPTKFLTQHLSYSQAPQPGVRAQIDVTDFDGDGRLDLLVGDYSRVIRLRKLSEQDQAAYDSLQQRRQEARAARKDLKGSKTEASTLDAKLEQLDKDLRSFRDAHGDTSLASFIWLFQRRPAQRGSNGK